MSIVHADGEGCALRLGVVRHHEREIEQVGPLRQKGGTDHARRVGQEEGDVLRGGGLRRHDEVTLVLPILVVDHDGHAEPADRIDGLLHAREAHQAATSTRQVLAQALDRDHRSLPHVPNCASPAAGEERAPVVASEEHRRQVQDVAVDESGGMEVVGHRGPTLDQQLENPALPEVGQNRLEVTGELERRVHPCARRRPAQNHPQGLVPLDPVVQTHRQLRIVGADRSGADEDGVRARPQPVHVAAGRLAGDPPARPVGRGGARGPGWPPSSARPRAGPCSGA